MRIDLKDFPIVWIYWNEASEQEAFTEIEKLFTRKVPFVLLTSDMSEQDEKEHDPAERKQASLWMKRNKADIRQYIKAMIVIEPSKAKRLASKAFTMIFEKFWGYPMICVEDREEALKAARSRLQIS